MLISTNGLLDPFFKQLTLLVENLQVWAQWHSRFSYKLKCLQTPIDKLKCTSDVHILMLDRPQTEGERRRLSVGSSRLDHGKEGSYSVKACEGIMG